jgi:L-lactate dehydrogenase complex protein LldG
MANSSRDNILAGIKTALTHLPERLPEMPDMTSPIYQVPENADPAIQFAEHFMARKGIFFYSESLDEFKTQIQGFVKEKGFRNIHIWEKVLAEEMQGVNFAFSTNDRNLSQIDCGITLCECLLARTGSMIVSSKQLAGRRLTVFPPTHIVVASTSQLLPDIKEGMAFMQKKYGSQLPSMISVVTGASRTADIEKTLVMGAHGPKELILFLIDDVEA